MNFPHRTALAAKYIRGSGIECGALHCPTVLPPEAKVTYVDRDPELVKATHHDVQIAVKDWVVDDATILRNFQSDSLDFVIAHHVLEHLTNALIALEVWARVLKPGGILFFSIPDRDHCFDRHRPLTSFTHLLADRIKMNGPNQEFEHYLDWFMNAEQERLPYEKAWEKAVEANRNETNIHFHVWNAATAEELVRRMVQEIWPLTGVRMRLEEEQYGGEMNFVLRRLA